MVYQGKDESCAVEGILDMLKEEVLNCEDLIPLYEKRVLSIEEEKKPLTDSLNKRLVNSKFQLDFYTKRLEEVKRLIKCIENEFGKESE